MKRFSFSAIRLLISMLGIISFLGTGISCSPQKVPAMDARTKELRGAVVVPEVHRACTLLLDGRGTDRVWRRAVRFSRFHLKKGYSGKPYAQSCVDMVKAGRWLLLGCTAFEKEGIIARESMPGTEMWFDDAFIVDIKGAESFSIMVNPLGALCVKRNGKIANALIRERKVQCVARIDNDNSWRVELAVDLSLLAPMPGKPFSVRALITRQRQARGCVEPFEESVFPAPPAMLSLSFENGWRQETTVSFDKALPQRFMGKRLLPVIYSASIPNTEALWKRVPAAILSPEDGKAPLDPFFEQTKIRSAVSDTEIAFRITCRERNPELILDKGKEIWNQDNIELFIGPEGYGYLQLLMSPGGRIAASQGKTGGRRVRRIKISKRIKFKSRKKARSWAITVTIPLAEIEKIAQAPENLHPRIYPWGIQIARMRPARVALSQPLQYSVFSVTRSATAHCPLRFAAIKVINVPATPSAEPKLRRPVLPRPVLSRKEREKLGASTLLREWIRKRAASIHAAEKKKISALKTSDAWTRYAAKLRSKMLKSLFLARKGKLPRKTPLRAHIVYDYKCDGFRNMGLVFQSQPSLPVAATLFVPDTGEKGVKRPVLIIIPAHHTQRNSRDVLVAGANFARAGGIALTTESIGSGERLVTAAYRHKRQQRNLTGTQILLAGETLEGWTAWDISRAIDYLLSRGDVDASRIAILGGVAGGGDVAALAALVDTRIALSIPFNFSVDAPFGGYYDPLRAYYGANKCGYTPWLTNAVIAPRVLVQAMEFGWSDRLQALQNNYKRIYALFGREDNVTFIHGGVGTHATHFNALHRPLIYKKLNKYFSMSIMKNKKEYRGHLSTAQLECYQSPGGRALIAAWRKKGIIKTPNRIAFDYARQRLFKARSRYKNSPVLLRKALDRILGDTSPVIFDASAVKIKKCGAWGPADVKGVWLPAEDGEQIRLGSALWICTPRTGTGKRPVVLAVAQAGKARFMAERAAEIKYLLSKNITVALLDVRGTGETSPGDSRLPEGPSSTLASAMWMLADNLPARRLKDIRTALRYLCAQPAVDEERVGVWGEGFSEPNGIAGTPILFQETGFRQANPEPKELAEPMGGFLALVAGLYPIRAKGKTVTLKCILARGTLCSFLSVLEEPHYYIPMDAVIPNLLSVCDTGDIIKALEKNGIKVSIEDLRDGMNRVVRSSFLTRSVNALAADTYKSYPAHAAVKEMARLFCHQVD